MKCVYIVKYVFYVLFRCASVHLYMKGFQKEKKKILKKVARSTDTPKKVEVFVRNMFFRKTVFGL